ncbi:HNH endonuclease [Aeromonas dhakensis]|uniref:HNH endonuclease n=1 Tax=Aeromonas dhakensis TaxID=196024 RepID=UPI0024429E4A|nr:HNH endonuclease [Aeromonas dhakensis]
MNCRCGKSPLPLLCSNITSPLPKLGYCSARGEHLQPRSNGGSNQTANIVAACRHCNGTRHKTPKVLSPEQYQKKVRARVGKGGWFPKGITSKVKGNKTNGV